MFCEKCGKVIDDDSTFCEFCGFNTSQNTGVVQSTNYYQSNEQQNKIDEGLTYESAYQPQQVRQIKKLSNKQIIIGVIVSILLVGAIVVVSLFLNTISFDKYILDELKVSGYSGYATASVSRGDIVNEYNLLYALEGKKTSDHDETDYDLEYDEYYGAFALEDAIEVDCKQKTTNLKNGDKVKVTITVDYDAINQIQGFKKRLRGSGKKEIVKEYTVDGLSDPLMLDPFKQFTGVAMYENDFFFLTNRSSEELGDYTVNYTNEGIKVYDGEELIDSVYFEINYDSYNLSNIKIGDKVTVGLNSYEGKLDEHGIYFSSIKQDVTVSKCSEVSSVKQITDNVADYLYIKDCCIDSVEDQESSNVSVNVLKTYVCQNEFYGNYYKLAFLISAVGEDGSKSTYKAETGKIYIGDDKKLLFDESNIDVYSANDYSFEDGYYTKYIEITEKEEN